jgi:ribose transport system substrate-binding protein
MARWLTQQQTAGSDRMAHKPWRRKVVAVVIAVMTVGLTACSVGSDGAASTSSSGSGKVSVGFAPLGLSLPILADAYQAAVTQSKQDHIRLQAIVSGSYVEAAEQQAGSQTLLNEGVKALMIDPSDSDAIGVTVKQANAQHVPVVMFIANDLGGGKVTSYVAANEEQISYQLSTAIFKMLGGNGEVGYIQGDIRQEAGYLREQGFRAALKQYPNIKLVAYGQATGFSESLAETLATNMLTAHPGIRAIITAYDGLTDGALAAAQAAHTNVLLAGVDGECQTLHDIWIGSETATADELWTNIAATAVNTAVKAAEGKSVPNRIVTPSYVITKPIMSEIINGTYPGETSLLKAQIQQGINGC